MRIEDSALYFAGLALAHALWSASDLEDGDLLVPLAFVSDRDAIKLLRFEAATQDEAVQTGLERMNAVMQSGRAWAFARDGIIREDDAARDVIIVEAWSHGTDEPITVIQRYVPFALNRKFTLVGSPELAINGRSLGASPGLTSALEVLQTGLCAHAKVAELLPSWTGG